MNLEELLDNIQEIENLRRSAFSDLEIERNYNDDLELFSMQCAKYCNNYYFDDVSDSKYYDNVRIGFYFQYGNIKVYPKPKYQIWSIGKGTVNKIMLNKNIVYLQQRLLEKDYNQIIVEEAFQEIEKRKVSVCELEQYLLDSQIEYTFFPKENYDDINLLKLDCQEIDLNKLVEIQKIIGVNKLRIAVDYISNDFKIEW